MIPIVFALVTLIGGSNAPVVKFTVNQFPPILFVALRALIAFTIIAPFILKTTKVTLGKRIIPLLIVNVIFAANWLLFASGVQKTTVTMSQLIYVPTSLVVALLSFFILGERFTKIQILGLAITIFGALILVFGSAKGSSLTFGDPIGNLMVTSGMFFWATYLVLSSRLSKVYSPLTIIFYNFAVSFIIASVFSLFDPLSKNFNPTSVEKTGFISLIYVAILSSAIYFYLNQWLIKHTSAFISSLQIYPIVAIASFLGVIYYQDQLSVSLIAAAIMIMLGVFLSTSYQYIGRSKKHA